MANRFYSSYLLRFWSAATPGTDTSSNSLVLQVQNLQTGMLWRLNSLDDLNELLVSNLEGYDPLLLPSDVHEKKLTEGSRLDSESA